MFRIIILRKEFFGKTPSYIKCPQFEIAYCEVKKYHIKDISRFDLDFIDILGESSLYKIKYN